MGEYGGNDSVASSGVDRRKLLKGTVAAGVGAAAWSAPNIKTLGFAPAYAQTCSVPPTVASFNGGSINNGTTCGGPAAYAEANHDPSGSSNGITFVANGTCLDLHDVSFSWDAAGPDAECNIRVYVLTPGQNEQCGSNGTRVPLDAAGTATVPIPSIDDNECPSGQVFVEIACSNDPDNCLPVV